MNIETLLEMSVSYPHVVNKISIHSKEVEENDVFVAVKGSMYNGQDYIQEAIQNGAKTIISEIDMENDHSVNYIKVDDTRKFLAIIANRFYEDISSKVTLIGVTGTNGKTSVTTFVHQYFRFLNKSITLIGTNGIYINDEYQEIENTTPNILYILEIFKTSIEKGINHIVMEVSSHAIKQHRIYGLKYDIVLLTNITIDHLDFHKTFEDYRNTKGSFLGSVADGIVLINKDIDDFSILENICRVKPITYGKRNADYQFYDEKCHVHGTEFILEIAHQKYKISSNLLGIFNVYNLVAFVAIIDNLNLFNHNTIEFLNSSLEVPGRMELIYHLNRTIVIDFAHTPDGVLNVLQFLNTIKRNRLILVMGCGGMRDKTKRPLIGEIAATYSDYFFITSDNPRWENNQLIMQEIEKGILENVKKSPLFGYLMIHNRKQAIEEALKYSKEGDIIAILGKGNEEFQIINDQSIPFSDKKIANQMIQKMGEGFN